jgi:hypothetical protein
MLVAIRVSSHAPFRDDTLDQHGQLDMSLFWQSLAAPESKKNQDVCARRGARYTSVRSERASQPREKDLKRSGRKTDHLCPDSDILYTTSGNVCNFFRENAPTFEDHGRRKCSQGYVSQSATVPVIGPNPLPVCCSSFMLDTMRPLVQSLVRRACRISPSLPSRSFHASSTWLYRRPEDDENYRITTCITTT